MLDKNNDLGEVKRRAIASPAIIVLSKEPEDIGRPGCDSLESSESDSSGSERCNKSLRLEDLQDWIVQ